MKLKMIISKLVIPLVLLGICLSETDAEAQGMRSMNSTRRQRPVPSSNIVFGPSYDGPRVRDYSWIHIDPEQERLFSVHDLVTVIVNEKAQVTLNSQFNRQKQAQLKAELKEFVKLGDGVLRNAGSTSPTIDTNLQGRLNATGQVTDSEGINYRIAATIVDVLPNGNLVLEARKSIRTSDDMWEYSLTGIIRPEDVLKNNTVLSENVADLQIVKRQNGKVFDSTKRPWGIKIYDLIWPF